MSSKEFTEDLIKRIVTEPEMVSVQEFGGEEDSVILEIIVHEKDKGAIIGRNGKMANALRTVIQAHAYINGLKKVKINIDSF